MGDSATPPEAVGLTAEELEASLDRVLAWIRAADSRVALVLPLATAMLGALAVMLPPPSEWAVMAAIASALAALLLMAAIACTAITSFPRTSGPKGSIVYFGGIIARDRAQFEQEILSASRDKYVRDLAQQCHRNAEIAELKYKWVQRGLACLFGATLPWSLAVLLLYAAV